MDITFADQRLYADTGPLPPQPGQPTVLCIHGVLNDHSVWAPFLAPLAQRGWNVLAVDLPGHGRSAGTPPASVADAASRLLAMLDALDIYRVAVVGHSWGSLIALHLAAMEPARVQRLVLVGTAFPMKVSPALLDMAESDPDQAIDLIARYSHTAPAAPSAETAADPASTPIEVSRALMHRVLDGNPQGHLLRTGFLACDRYADGLTDMARVRCPVTFVLGEADRMTPAKAARSLIEAAGPLGQTHVLPGGHDLMAEATDALLQVLQEALPEAATPAH